MLLRRDPGESTKIIDVHPTRYGIARSSPPPVPRPVTTTIIFLRLTFNNHRTLREADYQPSRFILLATSVLREPIRARSKLNNLQRIVHASSTLPTVHLSASIVFGHSGKGTAHPRLDPAEGRLEIWVHQSFWAVADLSSHSNRYTTAIHSTAVNNGIAPPVRTFCPQTSPET